MSAASVPKILLGLGALCLLVAALVFLAVAWAEMGMGGRTAVLVGLTATAGGLCAWLTTKGLRAGAESFVAVALGLLTLDIFGADSAGWLGSISGAALHDPPRRPVGADRDGRLDVRAPQSGGATGRRRTGRRARSASGRRWLGHGRPHRLRGRLPGRRPRHRGRSAGRLAGSALLHGCGLGWRGRVVVAEPARRGNQSRAGRADDGVAVRPVPDLAGAVRGRARRRTGGLRSPPA